MPKRPVAFVALACLATLVALAPSDALGGAADRKVQVAHLSPEAERAIKRGLEWLASHQNKDGSWGSRYQPAMTGLSLMAFMVKGYFPERGLYGSKLDRAVAYLLRKGAESGGYLGSSPQGMYEHALATLALSEAWGMTGREGVRDALKRAVMIILRAQNAEGGWRYQPQPIDADLSVTVMQIVALASAQEAGILVPLQVIRKAVAYVKACQNKSSGGFGYQRGGGSPRFGSSAAGLMSLLMCGERKSKAVERGLLYLKRMPESKFEKESFYYYGHYYSIQAMYQAGEGHYQQWYPQIQKALLRKQQADGSWAGGRGGDNSYGTSMAILILGVPYRFLPIYQR